MPRELLAGPLQRRQSLIPPHTCHCPAGLGTARWFGRSCTIGCGYRYAAALTGSGAGCSWSVLMRVIEAISPATPSPAITQKAHW
jgi:hypothetical protein